MEEVEEACVGEEEAPQAESEPRGNLEQLSQSRGHKQDLRWSENTVRGRSHGDAPEGAGPR